MPKIKRNHVAGLIIFLYSSLFAANVIFADVDVTTSLPSGTYDKALKIELTPTDPAAKIFYSFNPNGTPNDLLRYQGPILIKASTPFVYWTYINTENESKIKINDYVLDYPNEIRLGDGAIFEDGALKNIVLTNISGTPIDISYWEARNDLGKVIIPEGTMLDPGQNHEIIGLSGTGIISLFSPNEEKKDFIEVQEIKKVVAITPAPVVRKTAYIPKKAVKAAKPATVAVAMKPVETVEAPKPETTPDQALKSENNSAKPDLTPAQANPESIVPEMKKPGNDGFNDSIKASAQESGSTSNGRYIIIGVLVAAALGGAGMRFAKKDQ